MSFTSVTFLVFLPAVFGLHWLWRRKHWQNAVLLAASYFFYGWWDWRFLGLLAATSLIDYAVALGLARWDRPALRRALLAASLVASLGMLGFFKYFNFFVDSLVVALSVVGLDLNTSTLSIILPVGISFYTFQTLSYTLDVYWRRFPAQRDLLAYLTYVSFFPQLVAGPIERAQNLLPQFERSRQFSESEAVEGCRLMLWGFTKKMLIADNLALLVEEPFSAPATAGGPALLLATVAFAFQIYGDFSGYSDIAAGAARCFGIRLVRNFNYPYFAQSLTEFWRRWHLSLTTWFRDYLYIPLGGSRGTGAQIARNLFLTTLVSGLWHGAAWHFVIWGLLHGLGLAVERVTGWRQRQGPLPSTPGGDGVFPRLGALARMVWTFALVSLGWVFFRADSLGDALVILQRIGLGLLEPGAPAALWALAERHALTLGLLAGFVPIEWFNRRDWVPPMLSGRSRVVRWTVYTVLFWLLLLAGTRHTAEFIYFQF